jgi:hypothetical protein
LRRCEDESWRAVDGEHDQECCKPLHAKKGSSSPNSR